MCLGWRCGLRKSPPILLWLFIGKRPDAKTAATRPLRISISIVKNPAHTSGSFRLIPPTLVLCRPHPTTEVCQDRLARQTRRIANDEQENDCSCNTLSECGYRGRD